MNRSFFAHSRALAFTAALAAAPFFTASSQTTGAAAGPGIAGPANPATFSATANPGVAGVANPVTFSATADPGVAGIGAPTDTSAVVRPGIAGPANPLTYSPTTSFGVAGFSPLMSGLPVSTAPVPVGVTDPNAFPSLGGSALNNGVAGPADPLNFSVTDRAGVAGRAAAQPELTDSPADVAVTEPVESPVRQRPVTTGTSASVARGVVMGFSPRPTGNAPAVITNREGRVRIVRNGNGN